MNINEFYKLLGFPNVMRLYTVSSSTLVLLLLAIFLSWKNNVFWSMLPIHGAITFLLLYLVYMKTKLFMKATKDSLTGLFNRDYFFSTLENIIENKKAVSVLIMDLDRFKIVNDTLGHLAGDELLKLTALRLNTIFRGMQSPRKQDIVARLGGDEFAVLLYNEKSGEFDYDVICNRIIKEFAKPFSISDLTTDVGVSIGVANFPDHALSSTDLIRCADVAMYQAKRDRRGFAIYNKSKDTNTLEELSLMSGLRFAIRNDQLILYYQPRKDVKTGKILGVEALIRWIHPTIGFVEPNKFIGLAEQTGLIKEFTPWLVKTAITQILEWEQTQGIILGVSINMSTRCLVDNTLMTLVSKEISESGIDPGRVTIEVTESAIMSTPTESIRLLQMLDAAGIRISIDDFGTGHSTLLYLKDMPIKEIKIDKAFIEGIINNTQDQRIVNSIIALGTQMDCEVVAEGVENKETMEMLRTMGCSSVQGYYVSKPVKAETITAAFINTLQLIN
jgi:diguanylate cyclase (GGDEF)-like protein